MIASAPTKLILFGEQYVVYGAPALTIPTKPRNRIRLKKKTEEGIYVINPLGNGRIKNWSADGPPYLSAYAATAKKVSEICGREINNIEIEVIPGNAPKGMGTSASILAALSRALFSYLGKEPTINELFECTQEGETIAHNGRPSGIDAITVCKGKPQFFQKFFNPLRFDFRDAAVQLPDGTRIVVVDTFEGIRETTNETVARFARTKGITKKPTEMSEAELHAVYDEYMEVFDGCMKEMKADGDPEELGRWFNKNQELLNSAGLLCKTIEKARKAVLEAGAYGAKLTGGSGEGGTVICLVDEEKTEKVKMAAEAIGYKAFIVEMDSVGAVVESP